MKGLILVLVSIVLVLSCMENPPVQTDGDAHLQITVMWDTSSVDSISQFSALTNAKMILSSEYGVMIKYTDDEGILDLSNIPSATYQIAARGVLPEDNNILIVGSIKDVEVNSGYMVTDTIIAKPVSSTGIAINELYVGGPVNNIFFFYDQFIELYNSSDSTKYIDGMIVCRVSGTNNGTTLPGDDVGNDGDIDGITYIFKIPGLPGEKNHPFPPKTYLVLAQDAVDHSKTLSTSIDLSGADYEFVNQLSTTDFDNPNVPNLYNLRPDRTVDFMVNLVADIIIVATGEDTVWVDGIDIDTILDGVEYQSSGTKRITLDDRIDRGWVQSPPKYGGESMQRRDPGVDTNDGTLDWEILHKPTPGYQ